MKNIIIADDDPGLQDVIELVLKRAGYLTTVFSSAEPLMDNRFKEPDIFLIDRQLHNDDGLNVCRFLKTREKFGDTPVIIFSASTRMHEQAKQAGASDFLEKPFKTKTLLEMIGRHTA